MRSGRLHRAQHREVAADPLGVAQVVQAMARRGHELLCGQRAFLQTGQLLRSQMHADTKVRSQCDIAIEQQLRTRAATQAHHLLQQRLPTRRRQLPRTQLDPRDPVLQCKLQALQPARVVLRVGRDQVTVGLP